jgi:hypothetical protein
MKNLIKTGILLFCLLSFNAALANAATVFQNNFENNTNSLLGTNISGWGGATLTNTEGYNGSKGAKVPYGSSGVNAGVYLDTSNYSGSEVYIRFYAKVDCGTGSCYGGSKFLKFFGVNDSSGGYANTTLAITYDSGKLDTVSYGNGSTTQNDTGTGVWLSGGGWDAGVQTPTALGAINFNDKQWHCYEMYMKYSTGTNMDGVYKIWKDGTLWVEAKNLRNKHTSNIGKFASIQLGGYSSAPQWISPFTLYFDEVVISDQYIGPLSSTPNVALSAPKNLVIK